MSARGDTWTRLEQLTEAASAARQRVLDVDRAKDHAQAQAKAASTELADFYRDHPEGSNQARERKLTSALTKAREQADQPWAERRAGAEAAHRARTGEREQFIKANLEALLDEVTPEAEACAQHGEQIIAAIGECRREWGRLYQEINTLVTTASPGLHSALPASFDLEGLWNDARRITTVRPPLPPRTKPTEDEEQGDGIVRRMWAA